MRTYLGAAGAVVGLLVLASMGSLSAQTSVDGDAAAQRALVDRYCVSCHNPRNLANAGRLDLTGVDFSEPAQHVDIFEKVVAKMRAGLMPPAGRRRPDPADRSKLISYLETELDRIAAAAPDPGRTEPFHRLNRAEYRNAVRDLLDLDLDLTAFLPSDDASHGFDNIAGVLKISESRLEQYLAAARKISRAAIGSPVSAAAVNEYRVPETANQYRRMDGLPFGTRGGMLVQHHFAEDGEYELRIELLCRVGGECDGSVGFADEHRLVVLIDGAAVETFTLEPRKDYRPAPERTWRVRLPIKAGSHHIGAAFEKLPSIHEIDSLNERFVRPFYITGFIATPPQTIYQPFLDSITIVGPFLATGPGDTRSRRRVFVCEPRSGEEESCAQSIVRTLARRAYRRPVTDKDIEPLMASYVAEAARGGFEPGIEAALRLLLVSPEFLYRIERDPPGTPPGGIYAISDIELASRLSFFLWSSIPDELLLAEAESGQLQTPAALDEQVQRMLADPRSDALISNFAGQWLMLRNLDAQRPDLALFPNFDDSLRQAARRETELLFGAVLREQRPVSELLTADYTFVNERLARHYGIPRVYGNTPQRVTIPDERRRGILGHASILTVTSRPNRTSPVIRGRWILENVLGTPAPEPPADVPALQENENDAKATLGTMRERMVEHRKNPVCAGCHAMLDPTGLALENFSATGKWRDLDESGSKVDASGSMPDGTKFEDLNAFRAVLVKDPDLFATTVTKKLMTYALGRGLEPYDMPAVRTVVRDARPNGTRLADLVAGIVRSVPFTARRVDAPSDPPSQEALP